MIDNSFVKSDNHIHETLVFNARNQPEDPAVQLIVNIFKNKTATVKAFMPDYPAEQNFYWLRDKNRQLSEDVHKHINETIASRGATVTYCGF